MLLEEAGEEQGFFSRTSPGVLRRQPIKPFLRSVSILGPGRNGQPPESVGKGDILKKFNFRVGKYCRSSPCIGRVVRAERAGVFKDKSNFSNLIILTPAPKRPLLWPLRFAGKSEFLFFTSPSSKSSLPPSVTYNSPPLITLQTAPLGYKHSRC